MPDTGPKPARPIMIAGRRDRARHAPASQHYFAAFLVSALFHNRNRISDVAYLFIQNNSLTNTFRFTKATVVKSEYCEALCS
mgnify:CR=1 FL=1